MKYAVLAVLITIMFCFGLHVGLATRDSEQRRYELSPVVFRLLDYKNAPTLSRLITDDQEIKDCAKKIFRRGTLIIEENGVPDGP